jgi:putative ABC transport system ATP-binding protein
MFEFNNVKYKNILHVPSLIIESGKITAFTGSSGGGKTTLLKMLNKMLSPTEGSILFKGTDLKDIDPVSHRRKVAMLSQTPAIFEGSIRDNLQIGAIFQERDRFADTALEEVLERVHLNKDPDNPAGKLSGGEKQRLSLARILLLDPDVFLLDEPSSSQDDATEDLLIQMLVEIARKENKSMIMVTHAREIARKYADVIIEVQNGTVRRL